MKNFVKVIGIVFLGLLVLIILVPLLLTVAGFMLGSINFIFSLAVGLIKLAVLLAIGYLILVCLRAILR